MAGRGTSGGGTAAKGRAGPVFSRALRLACWAMMAGTLTACGDRGDAPAGVDVGTEVGQAAPPLEGVRADGSGYRLEARDGATAVVFFRAYQCGLCRERLRELQANLDEYDRAGVAVVAATADTQDDIARAVDELGLRFPVVSVDSATFVRWGLSPGAGGLPLPGSYLLDERGVVVFRHVGRNAADRAHDLELLAALRERREP